MNPAAKFNLIANKIISSNRLFIRIIETIKYLRYYIFVLISSVNMLLIHLRQLGKSGQSCSQSVLNARKKISIQPSAQQYLNTSKYMFVPNAKFILINYFITRQLLEYQILLLHFIKISIER